ncbi:MAG: phytoene desaturase family protein [Cyanobacteria bacterium P01_H01_bin.74]
MAQSTDNTVIVVGAGFGGIASALRLRAKGYAVKLLDQCPQLGGRAQVYSVGGFTHDAGPTVLTAPFLLEELFELFGKQLADYLELVPLNPWYQFVFPDGQVFNYGGSVEDTLQEIEAFNPADKTGYLNLVESSKAIFDVGFEQLGATPFHTFSTMLKTVPHLISLKAQEPVWNFVCRHLQDENLRQAFSIQPLLVGGNPFSTSSIYSLIHFLERKWGIHFAKGGTGAVVQALAKLMAEVGISVHLNTRVERLLIDDFKRCKGVLLSNGEKLNAGKVVSNADPAFVYRNWVNSESLSLSTKLKNKTAAYSMGLFVLYFGTQARYPNVEHHTIWLGKRYKALLDDIFKHQVLAEDFSLYLHRPTATDSSFAPEGCESFYVLCPVPNLQAEIDWRLEGPRLRDRIVKALSKTILPNLEQTICHDFFKTPEDFATSYSSLHGTGFSIAPILRQSAWFRYHNKSESIKNFYLTGAGTHPGAGLPGVLCSAKVVDALIPEAV